ncbi:DUF1896 family protein [Parafilimonas terrae]|uniref:DUF1896 domain-containing protein n=1 Tax=Parafilimonas terrae TaxID=1465490 RepID=A0A1I5XF36_9BACT|nr:DUF1896 family protein [Parafilimonas terrae]SFQ30575.1 protein of unknown function [Parafilimonas terrae]
MQNRLMEKLWTYIVHNNPELMLRLQEQQGVTQYLEEKVSGIMPQVMQLLEEGKPLYIIEETALEELTAGLKPSRYLYLLSVLEEEFPQDYKRLKENGTLTYEIVNLIEACKDIFSDFDFNTDNEDNRHLRYAIIGEVHNYFN